MIGQTMRFGPTRRKKEAKAEVPTAVVEEPVVETVAEQPAISPDLEKGWFHVTVVDGKYGIRKDAKVTSKRLRKIEGNELLTISEVKGNWGKLAKEDGWLYFGKDEINIKREEVVPEVEAPVVEPAAQEPPEPAKAPETGRHHVPIHLRGKHTVANTGTKVDNNIQLTDHDTISENGNKMIPFDPFGNRSFDPTPVDHVNATEVLKTPGDKNIYLYVTMHTTNDTTYGGILDIAFADNNGRTLYMRVLDSVQDDEELDRLTEKYAIPIIENKMGEDNPNWVFSGAFSACRSTLGAWLSPFIQDRRLIQTVYDKNPMHFLFFTELVTGVLGLDSLPGAFSKIPLDVNQLIMQNVLIKKDAGVKYEDRVVNVSPIIMASMEDRISYLNEVGYDVSGLVSDIPLVLDVLTIRAIHDSFAHFDEYPEVVQV